jgi:hypothetical protein
MRQVLVIATDARPEGAELDKLFMEEYIWECGYPLLIGKSGTGVLQDFWKHYHGRPAEMFLSSHGLLELHNDILTAIPRCAGELPVLRFLHTLGKMCLRAHSAGGGLQVIAD